MSGEHAGKGVVVTGAGGGMGRAIALAFANDGAHVMARDREEAGLAETRSLFAANAGSLDTMICDVRDEAALAELVDRAESRAGRLDVMVNNAAMLGQWVPLPKKSAKRSTL